MSIEWLGENVRGTVDRAAQAVLLPCRLPADPLKWLVASGLCALALAAAPASAQDRQVGAADPSAARVIPADTKVKVTEVTYEPPGVGRAAVGDTIKLRVEGLDELLAQAKSCSQIVLYIRGLPLQGSDPMKCDPDDGHVTFRLVRTDKSDENWRALLGRPTSFNRSFDVAVGVGDRSYPSDARIDLVIVPRAEFYFFLLSLAVAVGSLIWLARRSELLRVRGTHPGPGLQRPFSIGSCQMAFWLVLVMFAYAFEWLITQGLPVIPDSILALLGISSGTGLASVLIDKSKQDALAQEVPLSASRGFFVDILSDDAGISIHRFQLLLSTLVLGSIFIGSVYRFLQMPDFSATMLGLMTLTSGTYLGFKFPESRDARAAAQPVASEK